MTRQCTASGDVECIAELLSVYKVVFVTLGGCSVHQCIGGGGVNALGDIVTISIPLNTPDIYNKPRF